jgi:hypothetical protein
MGWNRDIFTYLLYEVNKDEKKRDNAGGRSKKFKQGNIKMNLRVTRM